MLAMFKTKPPRQEPVERFADREVCNRDTAEGRREYQRRTYEMEKRQSFMCAICGRIFGNPPEFDHQDGRGMNGSNRDDRITDNLGNWINAALCHACNRAKGSKRYYWLNRKYVPKLKEVA